MAALGGGQSVGGRQLEGDGGLQFEEAFEDLFADAYRLAYRILEHSGEAEDVAAEAMARALVSWRRVGAMASPGGWVMRVATNLAIDIARRRRFARNIGAEGRTGPGDSDTRIALRELLQRLPRRQRDVLALRYLVDLPEAEIAAVLGISRGAVKRHASRGIAQLRWRMRETERGVSVAW